MSGITVMIVIFAGFAVPMTAVRVRPAAVRISSRAQQTQADKTDGQ